ncbi:TonB-dependent receptor [Thiosulfatimonas sediminis]|uniref:TonB-dependent receptor n=1 Tax=Thiosulfatimonas sediminis TaxID=2675054 RepID=A0A6F8PTI6_9GAMM|nr:TonB-dependent receptor [Thiosulfatimonas sediminis]BBP45406.1 TonB-dependent receptor [Thiosulfatimonas sediminis]
MVSHSTKCAFPLRPLVAAIAFGFSAQAIANVVQIPRIDVVGNSEQAQLEQPGSVKLIDKEQLQLQQPLSTEDALKRVAGVNIKGEEETAVVANIGLRGLSSAETKTLILEDGVPVAPGLFIGNGRYYNPRIQHIESIEVLKGASSLRYGPSTIGGVINYQSKTPEEGLALSGRVGRFGLREATLEAGALSKSGDGQIGVIYTHAESDGFQDKDYQMDDLMIKGGMALANNQWVGVKISHYSNDANISYRGLFLDAYNQGATYNPAPDDYFLTDRNAIDLNHEWDINDKALLKTVVYWSEVSRDYWRYSVDTAASETAGRWVYTDDLTGNNRSFTRVGFDSRLNLQNNLLGFAGEAEMGVRYFTERSNDTRIRATREQDRTGINDRHLADSANSFAVFAQNRFDFNERLSITPGLRIESYEQTRKVLTDSNASESTNNTEVLPGIGLTYQLAKNSQLFASVYEAFSPAENAAALDGLTDQQLDAERSTNVEIGIRGNRERLNYELVAFQMDFENQVVDGNSDPNLSKQNGGATIHRGAELVLGYDFGAGLSLDGNLTYIPTSEFVGGDNDGNRISYSPEVLANLELSYQVWGLTTALAMHYTGLQFTDSANTIEIPEGAAGGIWGGKLESYKVFDLHAYYKANKQLDLFASVKNLTDERYIAGLRQGIYAGPSRSVELGMKYKF